jgi:serine-type D-Ala-D-Ala endopeptidase (penicillin-binding protein 7)
VETIRSGPPPAGGALLAALLLCAHGVAGAETRAVAAHDTERLALKSRAVLVVDEDTGETVAARNADTVMPVASLTKLMTALVVRELGQPLDEVLEITLDDIDDHKHTPSRLRVGSMISRDNLLLLALMASENRAAMALARNYPGGRLAFVARMNATAAELGMRHTRFVDPTGLSRHNVSTARDLRLLLEAVDGWPLIRDYSTRPQHSLYVGKRKLTFGTSNRLVRRDGWDIQLQKTGYTNEAGRCLVMRTMIAGRRVAMIFLNSHGKLTRYGDAARVRQNLERQERQRHAATMVSAS